MRGSARPHLNYKLMSMLTGNGENPQFYGQWTDEDSQNWLLATNFILTRQRSLSAWIPGLSTFKVTGFSATLIVIWVQRQWFAQCPFSNLHISTSSFVSLPLIVIILNVLVLAKLHSIVIEFWGVHRLVTNEPRLLLLVVCAQIQWTLQQYTFHC